MKILPSGKLKIKLKQVMWITLAWTVIGTLDALNIYAMSYSDYLVVRTYFNDFSRYLWVNSLSGFFSGIISGSILIFYLRERFRNRSFGFSLLINSIAISTINFAISAIAFDLFMHLKLIEGLFESHNMMEATALLRSVFYYKNLIFWSIIVVLTIVTLHVNDKYGPGVLWKLILGRYHSPREEERIFMFVDIKSSTTIAEKLGHINFFDLLNDFFSDITNAIIYTSGEVYQYVGDEVVVSWTMKNGTRRANCIRCFFGMQQAIHQKAGRYREKYGLVPEFKAGLHCGVVTTGEIGVIKKDIVFSGDVMNTASRIQSMCNEHGVKILMSKDLLDQLQLPPHGFNPQRVGMIELKGKRQKTELYTFEETRITEALVPSIEPAEPSS